MVLMRVVAGLIVGLLFAVSTGAAVQNTADVPEELLTVAEASGYERTATYDEVISLIERIGQRSEIMRTGVLGVTNEGRDIPLIFLANPPIENAQQAKQSGKPVAFIFANIHAGEVCGKEAVMMLAREIALDPGHPLLENLILVFAPIYNADGNERFAANAVNRRGQNGPIEMGQRPNAQGLDLNRDYVKLESPEARAMVAFCNEWDPLVSMDLHTTNGSYHRLTLTFDYPLNPSGHAGPRRFVADELLPTVRERLLERTGYETFYYGNFNRNRTTWTTYSAQPRFGGPYHGLRNHMNILSEAYAYAPFRDRVLCTREFVRDVLQYTSENHAQMQAIHDEARQWTIEAGRNPQPTDTVGIRHRPAAYRRPAIIKGWKEERTENGRRLRLDEPEDYSVVHLGQFEPTLSVVRPFAYIIEPGLEHIVEKLKQHGIKVEPFEGAAAVDEYTITEIDRARMAFQGHHNVLCDATAARASHDALRGSFIVRTAQPLGTLAVYILEPQSEDGLVAWNFFDEHISVGVTYPIRRVRSVDDLDS